MARTPARYCVCLGLLAIPADARGLTAQQVLDKVVSTYRNLTAVHMVAEREETGDAAGSPHSSEYELAA